MAIYMKFYAVEYECPVDGGGNYDIFSSLEEAESFFNTLTEQNNLIPIQIFSAMFNMERVYREDNRWNYDDYSDTFNGDTYQKIR